MKYIYICGYYVFIIENQLSMEVRKEAYGSDRNFYVQKKKKKYRTPPS